jgi:phospholipase C
VKRQHRQRNLKLTRRHFLAAAGSGAAALIGSNALFGSVQKARAIPAARVKGTIEDVQHVVILMQENRSFDHYFGTMSGVRGFGDRNIVPLPSGKAVWFQSDGKEEILPFHLDTTSTSAMRIPDLPHSWPDAHSAWDLGRFGRWPMYKQTTSMGYYQPTDIPFQRALANAFTVCDAHHCSIQSGTLANRVVFMTGTNVTPGRTQPADNQVDAVIDNSNNRGLSVGPYTWTTYPERLQRAGISWRIYQNPSDNWDGLLAPWESFAQYQSLQAGDPLYDNTFRAQTLDDLRRHVIDASLPQVSWIIPSPVWSEHPGESSPLQGASYIQQVLDCLTANADVWASCVFIVTFDENDGLFDHAPPPAVPAYDADGSLAGRTTLSEIGGMYYTDEINGVTATRPYGMGPRVPLYVISPWSRGGWVNSQVFDHTSTIRFLEARFGVYEPNISPWHRAVCGDLTSCFDFDDPNTELPQLPDMSIAPGEPLEVHGPPPMPPDPQTLPTQDSGVRYSRALPYVLHAHAREEVSLPELRLRFDNYGNAGAVFHVYDHLHLERVPRRYTVEAGKQLDDTWDTRGDRGRYQLQVIGPNGFARGFQGALHVDDPGDSPIPQVTLVYHADAGELELIAENLGAEACLLRVTPGVYRRDAVFRLELPSGFEPVSRRWSIDNNGNWYDFQVSCDALPGWSRRFAGRMENGSDGISDPALSRPRRWPRMW